MKFLKMKLVVHNLFVNKEEQPSLNKKLSNVDFPNSEIKYNADH